ncbi:hypothetical protein BT63DRAFT_59880 [Microthyrium microscopicum]|uniref:Uncharacterized protein n=1 Tax=Microthyrium microscopicum TaxID=703497 RepID=A0A6A6U2X3_9PEZI|nr:hypothetical protein BT63DRAFT_59880 [Microthyrium microscopicum]
MADDGLFDENGMIDEFRKTDSETWGYVIYRTVYTPSSDEDFPLAMEKLDRYIREDLYRSPHPTEGRRQVADAIMTGYQNNVLQDPEAFNQATSDDLRRHFLARLDNHDRRLAGWGPDNRSFVMIDEEVLSNIINAPDDSYDGERFGPEWQKQRLKVVDATFSPRPAPPAANTGRGRGRDHTGQDSGYPGWIWITMRKLWFLWHRTVHSGNLIG